MTYKLFIQTDRDGTLENIFFNTIEELNEKMEELDKEIAGPVVPPVVPETPSADLETPPAV